MKISNKHDAELFFDHYGIKPTLGLILTMIDSETYEKHICTISKIDENGVWVRRFNSNKEELVCIINLTLEQNK